MSRRARTREELAAHFWARVKVGTPKECWLWQSTQLPKGYGRLKVAGKDALAHRFAYESTKGSIPSGLVVMHRCDEPSCVNPGHLEVGTYADNTQDMVAKGRSARAERNGSRTKPEAMSRGENHHNAKITEDRVRFYKTARLAGHSQCSLVKVFGVGQTLLSRIDRGETWKHVEVHPSVLAELANG